MDNNRKILIFEDTNLLSNHLVDQWVEIADEAIMLRGRFTVALPGGRSPLQMLSRLAQNDLGDVWQNTHIFWADERFVPHDSPDSNYRLIQEHLFNYITLPPQNSHPVEVNVETVEIAAEMYKNEMVQFFALKEGLPVFDYVLLGLGEDGHIASIFPQMQDIDHPQRVTIPVSLNHLKNDRISISLAVINNARHVFLIAAGANKAHIVKDILENDAELPGSMINLNDGKFSFLIDAPAASQLSDPASLVKHDEELPL